jgi:hypothetical protein
MGTTDRRRPRPPGCRPWEQQPQETTQEYAHFRHYLSLGPQRSLAKACEGTALSLTRLKQLSKTWRWPYRAAAWDREEFLRRRREELDRCARTRERLLKESADWQKVAQLKFRSWVTRDNEGNLRLVRELTPAEAIRLWEVGAEVLEELQGAAVAAAYQESVPTKSGYYEEPAYRRRFREARHSAAYHMSPHTCEEIESVLWDVCVEWLHYYWARHPYPDSLDFEHCVWPWDLPYAEA